MNVFVTGGSGYIGTRLIAALLAGNHRVRALCRPASSVRIPPGAVAVVGDALSADSIAAALQDDDALVHLVGTPHPNPSKALEFETIDLASIKASVAAVRARSVAHLVYVSVAHPAPAMHAYVAARTAGEAAIREAGVTATIVQPWYVLGPGHWWPVLLLPGYALAACFPATRDTARRLGLVRLSQMVNALVAAVEAPPARGTQRWVDVPAIRRASALRTLA